MAFVWTEKLSVGVALIDEQHKALFKLGNDFFEACNQKKGYEQIDKAFSKLDNYVVTHFRDEEKYMTQIAYPGIASQKAAHKAFVEKLNTIKADYENSEGKNILVVLNAIQLISDWLIKHISIEDKKIGEFKK